MSKSGAQKNSPRILTGKCLCGETQYEVVDAFLYAHIFVGSKALWFTITDDLPQHQEFG